MSDTHGNKVPEEEEHEVYGNARWPLRTWQDARKAVVDAAMHATDLRDGRGGVTCARGQFSAKWTVLDAWGESPDDESFVILKHRPTHEILGYYRMYWPNELEDKKVESLDDVFMAPEQLPGVEVQGELTGDRNE